MNKIYCLLSSDNPGWMRVKALSEDGVVLAGHVSITKDFAKHDIGITSDWKHDIYAEAYPDGYELEWVDDPGSHEGFINAYEKYNELCDKGIEAEKNQPSIKVTVE